MPENGFHFKQFSILQDKCAMKVGTDAVLLGSWVRPEDEKTLLDIGTGTGVIAIMLAQKSQSLIDAIDVDENAFLQASENVKACPWSSRINVFHTSFQQFCQGNPRKYDLIVSNPPYFVDASKPIIEGRLKARHTNNNLSFDELISGVCQLLSVEGNFCVILPYKEGFDFKEKALSQGLYCNEMMKVKTKMDKLEKRLMMKFSFNPDLMKETELVVQENDLSYSLDYIEFTKDYYLGLKRNPQSKVS